MRSMRKCDSVMNDEYKFLEKYILKNGYADLDTLAYSVYQDMIRKSLLAGTCRDL